MRVGNIGLNSVIGGTLYVYKLLRGDIAPDIIWGLHQTHRPVLLAGDMPVGRLVDWPTPPLWGISLTKPPSSRPQLVYWFSYQKLSGANLLGPEIICTVIPAAVFPSGFTTFPMVWLHTIETNDKATGQNLKEYAERLGYTLSDFRDLAHKALAASLFMLLGARGE